MTISKRDVFIVFILAAILTHQNCGPVSFSVNEKGGNKILGCDPNDSLCVPPPQVDKPGVVTILLAMGDSDNMPNPTVDQVSAQVLAEAMVQFSSPVINPKVLVVLDNNNHGESPMDFKNLYQNLLRRYNPAYMNEPIGGLMAADIAGYDVVWIVNPGHPLGSKQTHDTLKAFSGGVILSGDDMARGNGFDNSDLTGLKFVDNGTEVTCAGTTYNVDNNLTTNHYEVSLDSTIFADLGSTHLSFTYGNDIDNSTPISTVEVLAYAKLNRSDCTQKRPVVVRYPK
jgi:hypothetical protein